MLIKLSNGIRPLKVLWRSHQAGSLRPLWDCPFSLMARLHLWMTNGQLRLPLCSLSTLLPVIALEDSAAFSWPKAFLLLKLKWPACLWQSFGLSNFVSNLRVCLRPLPSFSIALLLALRPMVLGEFRHMRPCKRRQDHWCNGSNVVIMLHVHGTMYLLTMDILGMKPPMLLHGP